ncbi:MAG: LPS export ABC transporter permease LptG [Magnetococcales bacterium]|nr:LPS export ABC transporter permease LptG [Magnetococcales bacterium]
MPILFRHLLGLYLGGVVRVIGIFLGLFLLMDGIESLRRFGDEVHFTWPDMVLYMVARIPAYMIQFLPPIALLAALLVLGRLARQNEIMIMRASGVPIYRILIPFLMGGMLLAVAHLLLQDRVIPWSNHLQQTLKDRLTGVPVDAASEGGNLWLRSGRQIIHARLASPHHRILLDVTVFAFDDHFHLASRIEAHKAEMVGDAWFLIRGVTYRFGDHLEVDRFDRRPWSVTLDAGQLDRTTPPPNSLSIRQLHQLAGRLVREGYDATPYWVMLQRKFADPLTTLAAVLLAFPFSLRLERLGGGTRSLIAGLLVGFGMFVLVDLTTALGMGGRLPPAVAAWSPVLFFLGIGGFLLLHLAAPVRERSWVIAWRRWRTARIR